jgi:HK97 family phage major capsid protein
MTIMQQIGRAAANVDSKRRAAEFTRYAVELLRAKGHPSQAAAAAQGARLPEDIVAVLKSAVTAGTTSNATWAESLAPYARLSDGFLETVAPYSAFDAIVATGSFFAVPMHTRVAVSTLAASGATVGEYAPKAITSLRFSSVDLTIRKAVSFVVLSDELVRNAGSATYQRVGNELRKAVGLTTDKAFLDALIQDTGVASNASTGLTAAEIVSDFDIMLQGLSLGATSKPFLVGSPALVQRLALMRGDNGAPTFPDVDIAGGDIAGVQVVPTDALTDTAVLLDASQIAADPGQVVLDASEQASLQLDDNPTDAASDLRSLWQSNLRALRAERYFAAMPLRPGAVSVLTSVSTS